MNKYVDAIKSLGFDSIKKIVDNKPERLHWQEADGKNALHYLCGVYSENDQGKQALSLEILKWFLKKGLDMNSIHNIDDRNCIFPATPLWWAYAKGRNEKIYKYLLRIGANPENCMFAIAWNDDAKAAALFKKHGAAIEKADGNETPFLAAFLWKRFNVAEWFLKNGANPNTLDPKGNSALFYAVKRKYDLDKIELLLKNGADKHLKNKEGVSPKALAESNRQRNMLKLFESYRPTL